MHQTISQRRAILDGLRQRCTLSTAEFYDKTGRFNPATLPRFTVVPSGGNQFGIVERSTGVVKDVCTGHRAACKRAIQLETCPPKKAKFCDMDAALDGSVLHYFRSVRRLWGCCMTDNYIVASSERQAKIEAAKVAFFMSGGQVTIGPGIPDHPLPPARSKKIDPETVLVRKRRRLRPSDAETVRRMTEAI